jgi:hypothetical protein
MMWVEILSRHRDVTARFKIAGAEARIGRGYDNDVVVDDPYVAAQHLRVFRDENGQLVAEDLGSANGVFLDGGADRVARVVVDGRQPIRIGHTLLRIREAGYVVEPERAAPSEAGVLPVVLAVVLSVLILGIELVDVWLTEIAESKVSVYLGPPLAICAAVLVWVGGWALMSRIFSGRAHFLRNLLIVLTGVCVFSLYNEVARFATYSWTFPSAITYGYVVAWLIAAAVCFLHLREVGRSRLLLKGALVLVLFGIVIAVQALQRSEAYSASGRQVVAHQLLPPSLRLVPLRDEDAFFADIAKLKAELNKDRQRVIAGDTGR